MKIFIPSGAILLFLLIIIAAVVIGIISDLLCFIKKIREDKNACKKKNTQNSQNVKKSY
jgi:hypothetical protein